jgi:hypothetical protein
MKILLPISEIPTFSKVTKRTGDKVYEVRDKIPIYGDCDKPMNEILASPGTRLLVSNGPNNSFAIVAVPETLEVLWEVTRDVLEQYLNDIEYQ